jgi:hypothetical protein
MNKANINKANMNKANINKANIKRPIIGSAMALGNRKRNNM